MGLFFGCCFPFFAACTMSFPLSNSQETVIRSDAMEVKSEGDRTIFHFEKNVQVSSDQFQATAQSLVAALDGNPLEASLRKGASTDGPRLVNLEASGSVYVEISQEEGKRKGSAHRLEIDPLLELFTLSGEATISQENKGTMSGHRIIFDRKKNHLKLEGNASESLSEDVSQNLSSSSKSPLEAVDHLESTVLASGEQSTLPAQAMPSAEAFSGVVDASALPPKTIPSAIPVHFPPLSLLKP